jgi:hypothetical protein
MPQPNAVGGTANPQAQVGNVERLGFLDTTADVGWFSGVVTSLPRRRSFHDVTYRNEINGRAKPSQKP